ncbi:MAG TPA: ABC transporter substrate-binding protein [Candidatus Cybelea sp.]|nr:ABC transporter substrate-binding protein [Candidatus Cybelea sp.]
MNRTPSDARRQSRGPRLNRRAFGAGASAAIVSSGMLMRPANAQMAPLKVGILLPKSSYEAAIGQSCQRGADIAQDLLNEMGYSVKLELMNADTESNVDVARSQAEKLISSGANVLIGAFDSGQSAAIAQVTEQHGTPYVVNIASATQITEQGYKFVVRNFLTAAQLINNGLALMKEYFVATGHTPKTAVYLHVNDTFGTQISQGIGKVFPTLNMPFKIVEEIAYDPAAKDLSVEVSRAKATGADIVMVTSRLNDAILLVREMVKQRFEPMGIISPGSPGMYEEQFYASLGKYSEYCTSNVPWYNPKSEVSERVLAAFKKKFPNDKPYGHIFNVGFTFEALLIAADAYTRAKTAEPVALMQALRSTKIEKHVMVGGPIQFDEKGQNNNIASVALQNLNQQPTVVLPKEAAQAAPVFPMPGWGSRG